jgi:hypothetical protein
MNDFFFDRHIPPVSGCVVNAVQSTANLQAVLLNNKIFIFE